MERISTDPSHSNEKAEIHSGAKTANDGRFIVLVSLKGTADKLNECKCSALMQLLRLKKKLISTP